MAGATALNGNTSLPRPTTSKPLAPEQKWALAETYLDGDELARRRLLDKWGKGRVRRSLLEFSHHLHELEYTALRMREDIK